MTETPEAPAHIPMCITQSWHVHLPLPNSDAWAKLKAEFFASTHISARDRMQYEADLETLQSAVTYWVLMEHHAGEQRPEHVTLVGWMVEAIDDE